ncbi:vWA domain-containing protein [Actinomyces culturomici]|uniref:vWA domain-containing protein n=1 Tax=Actinomyces culturomici TaxID=1926276 RepID=UPI000E207B16|nr:hypothetical protein [Actinomyces culturomici]
MRFPLLIALVVGACALALVLGWRAGGRTAPGSRGWVANTGYLKDLPQFRALVRRTRRVLLAALALLGLAVGATAVSAGAPVDRTIANERTASRDIVLCLDASGSMIPYDGRIADAFSRIVEHFSGERISLQLWNNRTDVKFPLTDDYALATRMLDETASVMSRGYLGEDSDGVYVTQELLDYTAGTVDESDASSSLVGDGLAACVLGFDHADSERSRLVLYATDNEVNGPQIYTLAQAIDFATSRDVAVTALYPGDSQLLTAEGSELRRLVEGAGGDFYDASDPASVDGIIEKIESLQRVELAKDARVLETDTPKGALGWAVVGVLGLLGLLAIGRL